MIVRQSHPSVMLIDPEIDYNSITMKWLEEWFLDWLILGNIQLHTKKQQNLFKEFFRCKCKYYWFFSAMSYHDSK